MTPRRRWPMPVSWSLPSTTPGITGATTSGTDSLEVLAGRSGDIKRVVDFMLGAWPDSGRVDGQRVGLFGFSVGGYTGLVVIGGNPDFRRGQSALRAIRRARLARLRAA